MVALFNNRNDRQSLRLDLTTYANVPSGNSAAAVQTNHARLDERESILLIIGQCHSNPRLALEYPRRFPKTSYQMPEQPQQCQAQWITLSLPVLGLHNER